MQCKQLKERIKAHELDASMLIKNFLGHFLEGEFEDVFGMLIAVVSRVAKKGAIFC